MTEFAVEPVRSSRIKVFSSVPARARWAVATLFFVNGAVVGNWVSRIPALQTNLGLSSGALGTALLMMAFGALVAMPVAGLCAERFGSQYVTRVAAVGCMGILPVLAIVPSIWLFVATLFCFGLAHGALDVSMNAQAVAVEKGYRRSIMSSFHALFSLGGLAGAAAGGVIAARHILPREHFVWVAGATMLATLASFPFLLDEGEEARSVVSEHSHMFVLPSRALFALGFLAFCCMMGEGAMADWSALYLRRVLRSSEGLAAAGYAAFSITMASTRFFGDALARRLGPTKLVRLGGSASLAGLILVLASPYQSLALLGFALVGAGLAAVVPMAFSAAGRTPGLSSGLALSSVTTVGYLGFLLGPPFIGFAAEWIGLRGALTILLATTGTIIVLADKVEPERLPARKR